MQSTPLASLLSGSSSTKVNEVAVEDWWAFLVLSKSDRVYHEILESTKLLLSLEPSQADFISLVENFDVLEEKDGDTLVKSMIKALRVTESTILHNLVSLSTPTSLEDTFKGSKAQHPTMTRIKEGIDLYSKLTKGEKRVSKSNPKVSPIVVS